ncbi:MAG: acetyl/propionyl-CoA carboxylase alpha subunit [Myxococcota bacterium]|jgi:acetyl/propionyl-CoA carboxylase alpha subunit
MDGPLTIERVLIANRGIVAARLIGACRAHGLESVVAFSEPDAEQALLDEADYAVYLNGRTVAETYLDPGRVVGAAMDAGCEALHPGTCFLAEHLGFFQRAANANVLVVAPPAQVAYRVVDRRSLRTLATGAGLPLIPASDPIPPGGDGLMEASRIGGPLYVKAVHGRALERVEKLADVPAAVQRVRSIARLVAGDEGVFLERAVDARRHVGAVVVGDGESPPVLLGWVDSSAERGRFTHLEECGRAVVPAALAPELVRQARALFAAVGWRGVGRIRWALTPDGGAYLLGISARLTNGFGLVEAVHGVDLIDAQLRLMTDGALGWEQPELADDAHGIQLRIYHEDDSGLRPTGVLEGLALPDGGAIRTAVGVDVGTPCSRETEPLLATVTVTGPTRQAAVVLARAALDGVRISGLPTNVERLRALLGRRDFWEGVHDARVLR